MDLEENHSFWKAIKTAKESGQTVIFTSTNTAEVQQCSNKTIILDQGAIVAVGNVQDVIKTNARGVVHLFPTTLLNIVFCIF
jgi:ABC-type multidrug transport system ATPase subunit